MRSTNYEKFCLLLWKNFILQWNHKLLFFYEVCVPMIVSLLLVIIRLMVDVTTVEKIVYNRTFTMDDFSLMRSYISDSKTLDIKNELGYSPAGCEFCSKIMTEVGKQADVEISAHKNSKILEYQIHNQSMIAGVDFGDKNKNADVYPKKLAFTIRFPSELRTPKKVLHIWHTNRLHPTGHTCGPRNREDEDGGTPSGYLREGFLTIQNQVSQAYIKLASSKPPKIPPIRMKRYPYGVYVEDPLPHKLAEIMSPIILLCYIQPAIYTVKYVCLEKEKQLKEVLIIMGLSNWLHWAAWFTKSFIVLSLSSVLLTYALTTKWSGSLAVITFSSFAAVLSFFIAYITATITFCFMLSTFFDRASTASAVMGLYWFTSFFPYAYLSINYDEISLSTKILWCTLTNTALGTGIKLITEWEMSGTGLDWSTAFEEAPDGDPLKMIHIIGVLFGMALVQMIVCLYVEQVRPGRFGVPKPWYFPFQKSFWLGEGQKIHEESTSHDTDSGIFEPEPADKEKGVIISELSKSFGQRQVIRNLSFSMYVDEITVLLGHNGAGKTTMILILIGMLQPSSGTAYILGRDIRTSIDEAREYLSICPQHNVLFEDLTVRDHLEFFAYLRGLRGDELDDEVDSYLEKTDLDSKAYMFPSDLSGGMQRKLSVSCAFCGGPLIVLCDDPSSGMDPMARRQLWNLLQEEKESRVILLTTQLMEEADLLADRIGILSAGRLACYGTSFFLKKKFGSGYTLICAKEKDCDSTHVTNFLKKFIPPLEMYGETDMELAYVLKEEYSPIFPKMLSNLERAIGKLKIIGFGLTYTSLEEVFMQTGTETMVLDSSKINFAYVSSLFSESKKLEGKKLKISQVQAMMYKKYLNMRRNTAMIIVQLLMIVAFVIFSVLVKATEQYIPQNPMTMRLKQYDETKIIIEAADEPGEPLASLIENLRNITKEAGFRHTVHHSQGVPFEQYYLSLPIRRRHMLDTQYVAGYTLTNDRYLIWLNNKLLHTAPLALNTLLNAVARSSLGPDAEIVITNHPLPYHDTTKLFLAHSGLGLGAQLAINTGFSMSFITASFSVFIIRERVTKAKLLQFISGIGGVLFWLTHFIWDFIYLTILVLILLLTLRLFDQEGYTSFSQLGRNFFIFECFAFSAIPLTYLMSTGYREPANGFARIAIYNLIFGVAFYTFALILNLEVLHLGEVPYAIETFTLLYPHFAMSKAIRMLYINHKLHIVCKPFMYLDDLLRCMLYPQCCKIPSYMTWNKPGMGRPIFYLISTGILFNFLVLSAQYRLTERFLNQYVNLYRRFKRYRLSMYKVPKAKETDADVNEERRLVDSLTRTSVRNYNVVLKRLTKFYGDYLAVNQLSIAVKENECFGLLGLNGAGKTTTFRMLVADIEATFGAAFVKGLNVQTHTREIHKEIGYCPQMDALFNNLTCRETLRFFAMLRGVPKNHIANLSENLTKAFGLMKHYDNLVHNYSLGKRRKLSTAVAVLGGPSVILLDEPTTGMDPASRRRIWTLVNLIRKTGKSIIVTSQSIDECIALCTRVSIMIDREIRCLGSIQHLRLKYSQGLVLKIKVMTLHTRTDQHSLRAPTNVREKKIEFWVHKMFPEAELEDMFQGLLSFMIPMSENLWSRVFGEVEKVKEDLYIEDYSISQTSLEEIFFLLTRKKKPAKS